MQREVDLRHQYTMWFVLAMVALLVALGGCSHPPDEVRIRDTIEAMRQGAEARDASAVLDGIAGDFTVQNGDVDRKALARILKIEFLRSEAVSVSLGSIDIAVDGDRATAKFPMTLRDRSRRWLPSGSETYDVVSGWRRDGSGWVCNNATWTAKE
jgi:ketosteroid isomerase-like protein